MTADIEHAYAVVVRYEWETHRPIEIKAMTASQADEIVRTATIPPGFYLSVVMGLSLVEAGRMETDLRNIG